MSLDDESFSLLKSAVQRFVRERLVLLEDQVEERDEVPLAVVEEMKDIGLFGLSIPEQYGGAGLSMAQECEIVFELGQTSLAFRSVVGTNIGIGTQAILLDGTQQQKEDYLPRIATGELVVSFHRHQALHHQRPPEQAPSP